MSNPYLFDIPLLIGFVFVWVVTPNVVDYLTALFFRIINKIANTEFVRSKDIQRPPKVETETTVLKPNRWDWQEYRRHRHAEAFVESSMWLSLGDD